MLRSCSILRDALLISVVAMGSAEASFHFYDIQEVFSNNDGSVQFIELFTVQGNQQFLGGHTAAFEINSTPQSIVNLSNLPGDSANRSVLIGTSNLATLYGVTPDFIIPANFLSAGATHFINFASGTDRVNLSLLPTNGMASLNGRIADSSQNSSGTSVNLVATPTNFAGRTATIPEPSGVVLFGFTSGFLASRRRRV